MGRISIETGRRIRNYRINQHMSQEALAEKCGLHPTYIGQIERGEKNATIESIEKIAGGLSISLSRLFENIGSENDGENIPLEAYRILQECSENDQKKLIQILQLSADLLG
ncbi:MAG: helix-turn-helix domain-containing protein [Ruminococcus flavefaciens]|nr:helix-turn-helix domain-containing protein [Ruminococcus flavefaciens]